MARTQFRLASVLRLRESARDERRGQLAEAFRAAETVDARLAELNVELAELKRMQTLHPGQLDVERLLEANRYEAVLRFEQSRALAEKKTIAEEIERRREALVIADRDVKVLEKLREKQLAQASEEASRREVKWLDEVAGRQHELREAGAWGE